jgi:hypothetical protein
LREGPVTKYDDFDYHVGDAVDKGQDPDGAFTHIGFMLAWLLSHDLGDSEFFGPDLVSQVLDGSLRPNELRDFSDGKLVADMLTPEGASFLDAYYSQGYLSDYGDEFGELPDYGVPDDPEHQARIDRRIGQAYQQWVAANRPAPGEPAAPWVSEPAIEPELEATLPQPITWQYSGPEELLANLTLPEGIRIERVEPQRSHVDPALESAVATAIGKSMDLESLPSHKWGSASLSRALRNLGVNRADALVVAGWGNDADPTVEIHRLKGVERDRLAAEFRPYIENRVRAKWGDGTVAELPARWGLATFAEPSTLVWFALDGFVVYLASVAPEDRVRATASRLIAGLRML